MYGFWLQGIMSWVYLSDLLSSGCHIAPNFLKLLRSFFLRWSQSKDINKAWYYMEFWKPVSMEYWKKNPN